MLYPSELRGRIKKFKAFSDSVQSICRRLCPILCPLASGLTSRIFDFSTLETQNGSYFGVDPDVTVSLEHLFADVSGQRTNRFLAHRWIFRKARNESVVEIMPAIGYAGFSTYALRSANSETNKEANEQARRMFDRAIALDHQYALACAFLGYTSLNDWFHQWSNDAAQSRDLAWELGQRAVALDDSLPTAHSLLVNVYL